MPISSFTIRNNQGQAKYFQIREELRRYITDYLSVGDSLSPEVKIAQRFGVARLTVHRAMRELTNEGILQRIPGRGTFVAAVPQKKLYRFIIPGLSGSISNSAMHLLLRYAIIEGAKRAARESDLKLEITAYSPSLDPEKQDVLFLQPPVPTLIFSPGPGYCMELERKMHAAKIPVVIVCAPVPATDLPCVYIRRDEGVRMLVDHLVRVHGHERVGFYAPDGNRKSPYFAARYRGWKQALQQTGINVKKCPVLFGGEAKTVAKYLENTRAWFCQNDETAYRFIGLCDHRGLKAGRDVAIVGYDDIPQSAMPGVSLTTVNPLREEAGWRAMLLLRDIAEGRKVESVSMTPLLKIRESCGCCLDQKSNGS